MFGDRDKNIICAVSTPPGVGGISVIRVSGDGALASVRALCPFLPASPETHKVYYGLLKDVGGKRAIDEVLVTWFADGRSFTGEATAEISCHGNPMICRDIIQALIETGARPADRGEFTYRAFMNNKLDLVQAESVLALIESRSTEASRLALRQLQGDLSHRLVRLEDDLIWCLANIEAGIDFSAEGIDVVDRTELQKRLSSVSAETSKLVDSFKSGRVLREGLKVVLVGRPNVGKSSLLNNLIEDDRAIVTDIPGTTRDTIEAETMFDGRRYVFTDTAGLHNSNDPVERLGIERSRKAFAEADAILFVVDAETGMTPEDEALFRELDPSRTVVLVNKIDRAGGASKNFMANGKTPAERVCFVSALDKTSRKKILEVLSREFAVETGEVSAVISSARHFERLSQAFAKVTEGMQAINDGVGNEFVALSLKEALLAIQETLGKRFDDEIMDRVFKEFCIGK